MNSVGNTMPFSEPGGRPARRRDFVRVTVAGASGATAGDRAHRRASCRRDAYMTTYETTNTTAPSRNDRAAA